MSYNRVKTKDETAGSPAGPAGPPTRRRRQRPEARRSIAAILDAAIRALNADPRVSMEDIARAAGVTRQTVYAHFPTRDALVNAAVEQVAADTTAAFDNIQIGDAAPADALVALLQAGWQVTARYPFVWSLPSVTPEEDASRHAFVLDRMLDLIRRGQESGDLDATLPADWLLTAGLAIGRAAQDQVQAGRMTIEEATMAVHHSIVRLLGVEAGQSSHGPVPGPWEAGPS